MGILLPIDGKSQAITNNKYPLYWRQRPSLEQCDRTTYSRATNQARPEQINAKHLWPEFVTTNLWAYAIQIANNAQNASFILQHHQRETHELLFTNTKVSQIPKHCNKCGYPAFVLASILENPSIINGVRGQH
jgi:hypothetical protein